MTKKNPEKDPSHPPEAEVFEQGDIVLKSGGPLMTIEEISINGEEARCKWGDQEDTFKIVTLRKPTLEEVAKNISRQEITIITEPCKVYLTDAEYKELAIQMSQVSAEISQAEDDLAAVKSRYKSRIDAGEAKRNEIAGIIRVGWEERPIECQLIKDYGEGTITKKRMDTGEVISSRPMSSEEKQRGLQFMGGEEAQAAEFKEERAS